MMVITSNAKSAHEMRLQIVKEVDRRIENITYRQHTTITATDKKTLAARHNELVQLRDFLAKIVIDDESLPSDIVRG